MVLLHRCDCRRWQRSLLTFGVSVPLLRARHPHHTPSPHSPSSSPRFSESIACDDGTLRFWDVKTGECRRILNGHTDGVLSVVYSPDGNRIATGSKDRAVRVWDVVTGTCCDILAGHDNWVEDIVYTPQEGKLVSASDDSRFGCGTWKQGTLTSHSSWIRTVVNSSNGGLLASGSEDRTVRLWNVATGGPSTVLPRSWARMRTAWSLVVKMDQCSSGRSSMSVVRTATNHEWRAYHNRSAYTGRAWVDATQHKATEARGHW